MIFFEKVLESSIMSTQLSIRANVSKKTLFEALKLAKDFEARYSAYKSDSFLSHINSKGAIEKITCTQEDIKLFERCLEASFLSEGEFDVSMGALTHGAYHFGFKNQKIATQDELDRQKKLVDFKSIILDEESISFKKKGMRLDLGGIGKGYVAKTIAKFLLKNGASKILVDVGGEIVSFGKKYIVGIRDPFSEGNLIYIESSKETLSISTSGDYERYIQSPHNNHILNKSSAKSSNIYSSITLLQNGLDIDLLDAYATAMFNKSDAYIKDFAKKENFASITIDKSSNIIFNNLSCLKIDSIHLG